MDYTPIYLPSYIAIPQCVTAERVEAVRGPLWAQSSDLQIYASRVWMESIYTQGFYKTRPISATVMLVCCIERILCMQPITVWCSDKCASTSRSLSSGEVIKTKKYSFPVWGSNSKRCVKIYHHCLSLNKLGNSIMSFRSREKGVGK